MLSADNKMNGDDRTVSDDEPSWPSFSDPNGINSERKKTNKTKHTDD